MRRSIVVVVALVGGVLGGTLFGGPVLSAAAHVQDVLEQNLDASGSFACTTGNRHVAVTNFPAIRTSRSRSAVHQNVVRPGTNVCGW